MSVGGAGGKELLFREEAAGDILASEISDGPHVALVVGNIQFNGI